MPASVRSIDGPLVSTSDLDGQTALFTGVFDLREVAREDLAPGKVAALWGVTGHSATTVLLETPGTRVGVRLVAFDPPPRTAIRDGAQGIDCDALGVIHFLVDDFEAGIALAQRRGLALRGRAAYAVPIDGRFTEGHLEGPDGVVCALLKVHDAPWSRFVRVRDGHFSEILGCSAPVSDTGPAGEFYRALGLDLVYQYEIESRGYEQLIGVDSRTRVRGFNYGLSTVDPMIGTIHYGLPAGTYRSLREQAVLPSRGLAGVRLSVTSVEQVAKVCRRGGWQVVAEPTDLRLRPYGRVRSLAVRAPHGVVHHFLEREP